MNRSLTVSPLRPHNKMPLPEIPHHQGGWSAEQIESVWAQDHWHTSGAENVEHAGWVFAGRLPNLRTNGESPKHAWATVINPEVGERNRHLDRLLASLLRRERTQRLLMAEAEERRLQQDSSPAGRERARCRLILGRLEPGRTYARFFKDNLPTSEEAKWQLLCHYQEYLRWMRVLLEGGSAPTDDDEELPELVD
ncbi:hypothetical protein DFH07DRAFT_966647 [Mycena maculata]|uniref:Uncharacterized protein n=1 Tax=Mycena maculata TaxID=230809 RepID=A0AAD7I945_9AGAR|nr:hypothetical protein DFH07DRAFT_966647 [Mycena maculata]